MSRFQFNIIFLLLSISILGISCVEEKSENQDNGTKKTQAVSKQTSAKKNKEIANSLGRQMFILCEACHSLEKGGLQKVGPNLHGIFGAKAGMKEGFKYSEAIKASGVVWDEDNMRLWLESPTSFIPDANMAFVGIKKEKQMDALIEYLKEKTK